VQSRTIHLNGAGTQLLGENFRPILSNNSRVSKVLRELSDFTSAMWNQFSEKSILPDKAATGSEEACT
jgi:hypothetical protein